MSRRGATHLRGILPIDKPSGMTSHDVVAAVRRASGEGRVGHAGTLDPSATGLLVVLLGPYTRLEPYLSSATKSYDAVIAFGSETDTDDAQGTVTATAEVPDRCLDPRYAREQLARFLGASMQTPPAYCALKVGGRVAHRQARAGEPLELSARPIEVRASELLSIDPAARTWSVAFTVSKGTYIRSLARDIGRACGSAAHLAQLRRTASGTIDLSCAHDLGAACEAFARGESAGLFLDPFDVLGLPVVEAGPSEALRSGGALTRPDWMDEGQMVAVSSSGEFAGLYRVDVDRLVPTVVFPERQAS